MGPRFPPSNKPPTVYRRGRSPRAAASASRYGLALAGLLLVPLSPTLSSAAADIDSPAPATRLAPSALIGDSSGKTLYVACAGADRVAVFDLVTRTVRRWMASPPNPQGIALTPNGEILIVVGAGPSSRVQAIRIADGKVMTDVAVGHTALCPVVSGDGRTLFVAQRFDHSVAVIDIQDGRRTAEIAVRREPVAMALADKERRLYVVNHLHSGRSDAGIIGATVSVIDVALSQVIQEIRLPRGASLARDIAISSDGRFAAVTHLLARYYLPTADVMFGAINANALSLLDLDRGEWMRLVYLDQSGAGAANPWSVRWESTHGDLVVTHAGTHELSVVGAPRRPQSPPRLKNRYPLGGRGPRALALVGTVAVAANYFSDDLSLIDLSSRNPVAETASLSEGSAPSLEQQGEDWFNDGTLCFQGWQSCASCHDDDARTDALNWDLLNDGEGNPKNAKSLLWSDRTPPSMALGVRSNATTAVRAGLRHILFAPPREDVALGIDAYLASLRPIPSPRLVHGRLSPAAERGRRIFENDSVGCAVCHSPPWHTDGEAYDVGTANARDRDKATFDTPTLAEVWRTAPYLHDGSAATLLDVVRERNPGDRHGSTSHLTPDELSDLVEYLLSL